MAHHKRGRAYRRHQDSRAKQRARAWLRRAWNGWQEPDAKAVGYHAGVHCVPCSCRFCCGNRRAMDGVTWQEVRSALSAREQLEEVMPPPTARRAAF